ncbi:MAG: apolipoprotein N-acyltransferase [Alphaproteobacteria bacterium]
MTTAVAGWLDRRPRWQALGLALLAGALATAALPPFHAVPLLLLSIPLLILLLDRCDTNLSAFWLGWWFGVGHFVTGFFWVANALAIAGAPPVAAIPLPLGVAIFMGLTGVLYRVIGKRVDAPVLAFALAWMVMEWTRGHFPFGGFPWNLLGYSWAFSDAMSQFASIGGAYGLSLLTLLVVAAPVHLVARSPEGWSFLRPLVVPVLILGLMLSYGLWRLPPDDTPAASGPVVRIVQANIPQELKWRADLRDDHFIRYLVMSELEPDQTVDLLLWPEAAIPYRLDQDIARTVTIGRLMRPGGYVLTGFPRAEVTPDGYNFFNSMLVIDHVGREQGLYDKFHLVPFGEYVPLPAFFAWANKLLNLFGFEDGVAKLVAGGGDFVAGAGPVVMDLPGLPSVSPLICYEVIFPGRVTPDDDRPEWLFNLTNDSWYGDLSGPFQHMTIARFRSIEEGLPMVRAAQTGVSALIDGHGRVLYQLGLGKQGVIDGVLPPALQATIYARYGNLVFWLMITICGLGALIIGFRQRSDESVAKQTLDRESQAS